MQRIVLILALLVAAPAALAHSGGTDRAGCHTDHRTGVYHCH
ncbi:MAG: YHYH domain-containing protein [Rhodospirillaceae bacterium]